MHFRRMIRLDHQSILRSVNGEKRKQKRKNYSLTELHKQIAFPPSKPKNTIAILETAASIILMVQFCGLPNNPYIWPILKFPFLFYKIWEPTIMALCKPTFVALLINTIGHPYTWN